MRGARYLPQRKGRASRTGSRGSGAAALAALAAGAEEPPAKVKVEKPASDEEREDTGAGTLSQHIFASLPF